MSLSKTTTAIVVTGQQERKLVKYMENRLEIIYIRRELRKCKDKKKCTMILIGKGGEKEGDLKSDRNREGKKSKEKRSELRPVKVVSNVIKSQVLQMHKNTCTPP